jgi:hypothetical protein
MGSSPQRWPGCSAVLLAFVVILSTDVNTCDGFLASQLVGKSFRSPASMDASKNRRLRSCILTLRAAESLKAEELARQADEAMKSALEAEARAALLREKSLAVSRKGKGTMTVTKPVQEEMMEYIPDDAKLAEEMSQVLSGLQNRGRGGANDPLCGVRSLDIASLCEQEKQDNLYCM